MRRLLPMLVLLGCLPSGVDEDLDGDGYTDDDCNDLADWTHPGANDVPGNGIDEDCDGVDAQAPIDQDRDGSPEGEDCDDLDPFRGPRITESCNGIDDDCDEAIDEDLDADGDGVLPCGADGDTGTPDDDCDDARPEISPLASELCDGSDTDCDGLIDEGFDFDADGTTICGSDGQLGTDDDDCDDLDPAVAPENWDSCGLGDEDCDGAVDEDADPDRDGFTDCPTTQPPDCDPDDADSYPGAEELCDGDDNDCDGAVDDGLGSDADGDGAAACWDCDDGDASRHPEAIDTPGDGIDQDCSGADQVSNCPGAGFSVAEAEPNNSIGSANTVTANGDLYLRGTCASASDVDTFTVNMTCFGPLRATLSWSAGAVSVRVAPASGAAATTSGPSPQTAALTLGAAGILTYQVTCGAGSSGSGWEVEAIWQ